MDITDSMLTEVKETLRRMYREENIKPYTTMAVERIYTEVLNGTYIGPSPDFFIPPRAITNTWRAYTKEQKEEVWYFLAALDKSLHTNTWRRSFNIYVHETLADESLAVGVQINNKLETCSTKFKDLYEILQLSPNHRLFRWIKLEVDGIGITWKNRYGREFKNYTKEMFERFDVWDMLGYVGHDHSRIEIANFFKSYVPPTVPTSLKFLPISSVGVNDIDIIRTLYTGSNAYDVCDLTPVRQRIYMASISQPLSNMYNVNQRLEIVTMLIQYQDHFIQSVLKSRAPWEVVQKALEIYSYPVHNVNDIETHTLRLMDILSKVNPV